MRALILNITPLVWLRAKLAAAVAGRRAYWGWPGGLRLGDVPPPELPGAGWVRCRTRLGGICGSDLAAILLRHPPDSILQAFGSMPMILGHEAVAKVVEAAGTDDAAWVGRRVCVEPTLGCAARGIDPPCPRCREGRFNVCEHFAADATNNPLGLPNGTSTGYNARTGGAWGELFVAHVSQLVPLPPALTDEQAVLTDPLACGLHAVLRARLDAAERVCVLGAGTIGLSVLAALRAVGWAGQADVLARHAFQDALARRLGASAVLRPAAPPGKSGDMLDTVAAHTGGRVVRGRFGAGILTSGGYDVVFDCIGSPQTFTDSLRLARAGGQVVLVGTAGAGRMDPTPVWFHEVDVVGAYGRQLESWQGRQIGTYQLVHELTLSGRLATEGLLTHTFRLEQYHQAMAGATDPASSSCVKAAFDLR